ncbi:MFS transporter [Paenibacillus sp. SI8]|uniref:MFS transporter n=1 Tax=unclassified Paenibacillus TaxID=185978 RepID=UPI00346741E5
MSELASPFPSNSNFIPTPGSAPNKSLWRNRAFLCMFASYCVSLLGDTFHSIALNLWVLQTTGSAKLMSIVLIIHLITNMLFGSFAGTVADRMNRRTLMLISDIGRCLWVGGIAWLMFTPGNHLPFIFVLTALSAFTGLFYTPSFQASLSVLVGKERIHQAISTISIADNIIRISGFALGGIAVAAFGGAFAIALDAFTYFISILLLLGAGSFLSAASPAQKGKRTPFFRDFISGFRYIWQHAFARSAVLLLPSIFLFFLSSLMLIQVMAVRVWHAHPFSFGLIEAFIPLGYVLGSGFILLMGARLKHRGKWIVGSLIAMGPCYLLLSQVTSAPYGLPLILVTGFLFSFSTLIIQTILRIEIDPGLQGRFFGTLGSLSSVATPLGIAICSIGADRFGPSLILACTGTGMLTLGVLAFLYAKTIRQYP